MSKLTTNQILSFIEKTLSINVSKFQLQQNRYLTKTNKLGEEVIVFSTGEKFTPEKENYEYDLSYAVVLSSNGEEVCVIQKIQGEGILGSLNPDYISPSFEEKKNQIIFCVSKDINPEMDEEYHDKTYVCWTTALYYSLLGDGSIAQGGLFEYLEGEGSEIPDKVWQAMSHLGTPDQPESENTVYFFDVDESIPDVVNLLRAEGLVYSEELAKDLNLHGDYCGICYDVARWDETAGVVERNKKNLKNKLDHL